MQHSPRLPGLWMAKALADRGHACAVFVAVIVIATAVIGRATAWQPAPRQESGPVAIPVAVFGSDDRTPTPAKYKDVHEKIGLFFNLRRRTVCTALCLARDVIATAGHCLPATVGDRPARRGHSCFARN